MEQYQLFLRRICTSLKGKFNTLLTLSGSSQFIFRSSTLPRKDSEIMQKNFSHNVWFKLHRWTKKIHEVTQGEDHFAKQSIKGGLTANTAELLEFYRTLEENQVKVIMTQTNPPPPLPPSFLLGIYIMTSPWRYGQISDQTQSGLTRIITGAWRLMTRTHQCMYRRYDICSLQ